MTDRRIAVRSGDVQVTSDELGERLERASAAQPLAPGRLVLIIDADPAEALVRAFEVRAAGGVPLLGDDRWTDEFRCSVEALVAASAPAPDAAWATLSSGSTGAPRVIVRTASSWSDSFDAVAGLIGLTADDVVYLPSPLTSSVSVFSAAHARAAGAAVLLPRAHAVSDEDLAVATVVHGTPQALRTIVERLEAGTPHRIRVVLVGGAHLDGALRERAEAQGVRIVSYYGAAELSFVAVDTDGLGLRAFPGVEVRIEDGVLFVRSTFFASGYLDGVAGSFRVDADGWGTVGDLAEVVDEEDRQDARGPALRLRGRSDGAILTAAATVVPEDVEAALRCIDGIEDAVVFGIPHPSIGALVAVVLQLRDHPSSPTLQTIRSEARTRLASSHLPRRWYRSTQLPRTSSGKPARAEIRRATLAGEMSRCV
jgi:long-chain acyl-CoA synthetase